MDPETRPLSARNMPFTVADERSDTKAHAVPANSRAHGSSATSVLRMWGDCADRTAWKLQSDPVRVQREGDLPWHCSVALEGRGTRPFGGTESRNPRSSGSRLRSQPAIHRRDDASAFFRRALRSARGVAVDGDVCAEEPRRLLRSARLALEAGITPSFRARMVPKSLTAPATEPYHRRALTLEV